MSCINYNHIFTLQRPRERIKFNFGSRLFQTADPEWKCVFPGIGNDIGKWFFPDGFNTRSLSGGTQFARQTDLHGRLVPLDKSGNGPLETDASERTLNSVLRAWVKLITDAAKECKMDFNHPVVKAAVHGFKPSSQNPLMKKLRDFLLAGWKARVGIRPEGNWEWIPVGAEVPVTDFRSRRATGIDLVVMDPSGQFIAIELKWGYLNSYSKKADPSKRSQEPHKWMRPPFEMHPVNAERFAMIEVLWGATMFDETYKEKIAVAVAMNVNTNGVTVSFDHQFVSAVSEHLIHKLAELNKRRKELFVERQQKKERKYVKEYYKTLQSQHGIPVPKAPRVAKQRKKKKQTTEEEEKTDQMANGRPHPILFAQSIAKVVEGALANQAKLYEKAFEIFKDPEGERKEKPKRGKKRKVSGKQKDGEDVKEPALPVTGSDGPIVKEIDIEEEQADPSKVKVNLSLAKAERAEWAKKRAKEYRARKKAAAKK